MKNRILIIAFVFCSSAILAPTPNLSAEARYWLSESTPSHKIEHEEQHVGFGKFIHERLTILSFSLRRACKRGSLSVSEAQSFKDGMLEFIAGIRHMMVCIEKAKPWSGECKSTLKNNLEDLKSFAHTIRNQRLRAISSGRLAHVLYGEGAQALDYLDEAHGHLVKAINEIEQILL